MYPLVLSKVTASEIIREKGENAVQVGIISILRALLIFTSGVRRGRNNSCARGWVPHGNIRSLSWFNMGGVTCSPFASPAFVLLSPPCHTTPTPPFPLPPLPFLCSFVKIFTFCIMVHCHYPPHMCTVHARIERIPDSKWFCIRVARATSW